MKPLAMALLLGLCTAVGGSAQSSEHGEFWIPTNVHWKHIDGEPKGESTASSVVFYFARGEWFVRDDCWLIKNGKAITISDGDPHNEYVGRSEPILDGMQLKYRLVRRTVERAGEMLPGSLISEDASVLAVSGLSIGGRSKFFRRVLPTNAGEFEARYDDLIVHNVQNLW